MTSERTQCPLIDDVPSLRGGVFPDEAIPTFEKIALLAMT
jgi:hypothetical protein